MIGGVQKVLVFNLHFMWKRAVLLILFGLLVLDGLAQQQYRAVFSGGRVYLSDNNKFTQVQNGQLIDENSQIELVGNALVVLMDRAGRLTRFSLSGKYDLSSLGKGGVADSSAFVKSVWDTYYEGIQRGSVEEEMLKKQAERVSWKPFELLIPSSSQFYGNHLVLQWAGGKEPYYTVELINEFGEVFETTSSDKPEFSLDLTGPNMIWKDEITVRVRQPTSDRMTMLHSLDRLSPPDYEKLDRLVKKYFHDENFEVMLTKAAFFENQWLFADAITVLTKLRKEDIALMENYWNQYLIRNGFYYNSKL